MYQLFYKIVKSQNCYLKKFMVYINVIFYVNSILECYTKYFFLFWSQKIVWRIYLTMARKLYRRFSWHAQNNCETQQYLVKLFIMHFYRYFCQKLGKLKTLDKYIRRSSTCWAKHRPICLSLAWEGVVFVMYCEIAVTSATEPFKIYCPPFFVWRFVVKIFSTPDLLEIVQNCPKYPIYSCDYNLQFLNLSSKPDLLF